MIQFPNKNMSVVENQIVERLVTDILAAGFTVSVYDGGDYCLKHCTSLEAIIEALASTDSDELVLHLPKNSEGLRMRVGWIMLVWGNDTAVISDYTVNLEAVMRGADELADKLEDGNATIVEATTKMCIFWQNESARAYAAARWEYENGALSRTPAAQERAAEYAREVEVRLSQLVGCW